MDHAFLIEHVGPLQHSGGKAARTRFRAVCTCGFATKWRKYGPALEEDRHEHLRAAEEAGERVDWGFRAKPSR